MCPQGCGGSSPPFGTSMSGSVSHPDVRVLVAALVPVTIDLHRLERARHDVVAAVGKAHLGPLLPLRDRAGDHDGARHDAERLRAQPPVRADPRVDWSAVLARPPDVTLHRREWIPLLHGGTNRSD